MAFGGTMEGSRRRLRVVEADLAKGPGAPHASSVVALADPIHVDKEAGFLRGHGTLIVGQGDLQAAVCGVVERVNKLISVRPLRSRYIADTGDVIVGRIVEVAGKRWKVDVGGTQEAHLMLSAVNLPGGIQRRRTAEDELNMRSLYAEHDLISAEVQAVQQDGSAALHTRSTKYGKLGSGQLVQVPPALIRRQKQHFCALAPCGVAVILGRNGFVWVSSPPAPDAALGARGGGDHEGREGGGEEHAVVPLAERERICRAANAVRVLAALRFTITPASIVDAYVKSEGWGVKIKDMLGQEFQVRYAEGEASKRAAGREGAIGMDIS